MKLNFYFLFIIFNIFYKNSFTFIIFPFKTRKPTIKNEDKNITLLLRSIVDNNIFINITIAEPKQIIEAFLRTDLEEFYFSEKTNLDINTNSPNPLIFDVNSSINKFYNISASSFIEITNF